MQLLFLWKHQCLPFQRRRLIDPDALNFLDQSSSAISTPFQLDDPFNGKQSHIPLKSNFILKWLVFVYDLWQNLNCQSDLVHEHHVLPLSPIAHLSSKKLHNLVVGYNISFIEVIQPSSHCGFQRLFWPVWSFEKFDETLSTQVEFKITNCEGQRAFFVDQWFRKFILNAKVANISFRTNMNFKSINYCMLFSQLWTNTHSPTICSLSLIDAVVLQWILWFMKEGSCGA